MGKVIQLFQTGDAKRREAALEQISLPFSARPKLYAVIASHIAGAAEFACLVQALHVSQVLDMRTAPRLDLVAPTRAQAFHLFESSGIQYRDVLGRVEARSYSETNLPLVLTEVQSAAAQFSAASEAGLLLFESSAFRDVCSDFLETVFEVERLSAAQVDFYATERLRM